MQLRRDTSAGRVRISASRGYGLSVTALNVIGFLIHVMVARTFDAALFGSVAALLALLVLFQVPANAFQVLVARAVADSRPEGFAGRSASVATGPLLADAVAWGAASALVLVAVSPLLRAWLHLPTVAGAALLGAYAVPVAIGVVPKGLLFGEERYGWLAGSMLAGAGVQLVLATIVVHAGHGPQATIAAMVVGELVTSAMLVAALASRWVRTAPDAVRLAIEWRDARLPATAFAGFWLLTVMDVVLAQHYLPGARSGTYAAAATAAQIAIFVPAAISASAFARVGSSTTATRARRVLLRGTAIVVLVGAGAVVAVITFARTLVDRAYAGAYPQAVPIVGLLAAAGAALGLSALLLRYHLAAERRLVPLTSLAGIGMMACGVIAQHRSGVEIADWTAATCFAVTAVMLLAAFTGGRRTQPGLIEQASLALLDADLDLTIVVPYYNPGHLLAGNIERLMQVLAASGSTFEVIAVSDGSTDGSERSIQAVDDPRLVHVVLPRNVGKGAALRVGLGKGRGRWLGFIDADGDLDPYLFEPFQVLTHLYDPEVILGSKRHPLSEVEYPKIRRLYSWGYQRLIHAFFRLQVGDTQTGIKLVRRDVLAAVLPRMVEKRFAFDLELFVIARRLGYRRFLEAPVRLRHQFTSTVSFRSVRRTLYDTVAIFYRLRVLRTYDEPRAAASRRDAVNFDLMTLRNGRLRPRASSAGSPMGSLTR